MIKTILTVLILVMTYPVMADTTCHEDAFGHQRCTHDRSGERTTIKADVFGNDVTTDDSGKVIQKCHTDVFKNYRCEK